MRTFTILVVILLAGSGNMVFAETEIHKYTDEDGVIHIGGKGSSRPVAIKPSTIKPKSSQKQVGPPSKIEFEAICNKDNYPRKNDARSDDTFLDYIQRAGNLAPVILAEDTWPSYKSAVLRALEGCVKIYSLELDARKQRREYEAMVDKLQRMK